MHSCPLGSQPIVRSFSRPRTREGGWVRAVIVVALASGQTGALSTESDRAGYWLSADLQGPRGSQIAAATKLASLANISSMRPKEGHLPPGKFVGQTSDIHSALAWVSLALFVGAGPGFGEDPQADQMIREYVAPIPSASLLTDQRVFVTSIIVTGATSQGSIRAIHWPTDPKNILPPALPWSTAALLPSSAPLFAAPNARPPTVSHRHSIVQRVGSLFVLSTLDRCEEQRGNRRDRPPQCLRWAQVVSRVGNRFTAGYLPNHQVARLDAWQRGAAPLPRAQLIASHTIDDTESGRAVFLLVFRASDNQLHRKTIEVPLLNGAYPRATLSVEAGIATIQLENHRPIRVTLSPDLDTLRNDSP